MANVRSFLCVAILLTAFAPAEAVPIIAYTGPPNPFGGGIGGYGINNGLAIQWASTVGFINVDITADLSALPGRTGTATAYLTTAIGPTTTAANQIAQTTVTLPAFSTSNQTVSLFTGLTLGPGQYSLVITSSTNGVWTSSDTSQWTSTGFCQTVPVNCPVSVPFPNFQHTALNTPPLNPFGPARTFIPLTIGTGVLHYSVSGQLAGTAPPPPSQVPGPSSFALMLIGLAVGARRLRAR